MTAAAVRSGEYSISTVLSGAADALRSHFGVYLLVSAIFGGIPAVLVEMASARLGGGLNPLLTMAIGQLVSTIPASVASGALVQTTYMHMTGRGASLGGAMRTGLAHLLPLCAIAIIYGVALTLGFLFLIVPALFMCTTWAVLAPVQVVEDRGVFAAFDRSAQLTEGRRGSILGILVLLSLAKGLLSLLLMAVGGATITILPASAVVLTAVRTGLTSTVSTMVGAAVVAVLYFELRRNREGVDTQSLASIFD